MSGSWLTLKPRVWRRPDGAWVAELDHISWVDSTDFHTWERALEHALWLGLIYGVWAD